MWFKNTFLLIGLLGLLPINPSNTSSNERFPLTKTPLVCGINETFTRGQESDRISPSNWQRHPKINAVRRVVQSVSAGLRKAAFKTSTREFAYCDPYEDTLRKIAVDSRGVARRYEKRAGSEDSSLTWEHSSLTWEHYYDDLGRLRFVFIAGGAVNGAHLEHRIYFDESGQRVWEDHKYIKGPEYSFPEVWPDEQLQKVDPAAAFTATSRCPETKAPQQLKKAS